MSKKDQLQELLLELESLSNKIGDITLELREGPSPTSNKCVSVDLQIHKAKEALQALIEHLSDKDKTPTHAMYVKALHVVNNCGCSAPTLEFLNGMLDKASTYHKIAKRTIILNELIRFRFLTSNQIDTIVSDPIYRKKWDYNKNVESKIKTILKNK